MRVLGIDPGSRVMGLGLVEHRGDQLACVYSQAVRLPDAALQQRLGIIFETVTETLQTYQPDVVSVEQVFMANNAKSALTLGHARGSAICAVVTRSLEVAEYSARQIKQSVVGKGSASKEQVQHMVRILLGLTANPPADAADALACAICHINISQVSGKIANQGVVQ